MEQYIKDHDLPHNFLKKHSRTPKVLDLKEAPPGAPLLAQILEDESEFLHSTIDRKFYVKYSVF